jgi:ABC-type microcin C transport system permease subunit YejB
VVLATGSGLVSRNWPLSPLLTIKVIAGLIAIAANMICIPLVCMRAAATDDSRVRRLSKQVTMTGLAIPFGVLALVLGFGFFAPG